MLYDQYGREIPPQQYEKPISGRSLIGDVTDRIYLDVARNLTPAKVDRILSNASHGDVEEQAELSELILEKNHVIADAFDIRCKAVLGLPWHVEEGEDTPAGKRPQRILKSLCVLPVAAGRTVSVHCLLICLKV